jgi:hypothetical protein
MAHLGVTGTMRTAAVEALLGLPPLHEKMEEAQAGIYTLSCDEECKPKSIFLC